MLYPMNVIGSNRSLKRLLQLADGPGKLNSGSALVSTGDLKSVSAKPTGNLVQITLCDAKPGAELLRGEELPKNWASEDPALNLEMNARPLPYRGFAGERAKVDQHARRDQQIPLPFPDAAREAYFHAR